MAYDVHAHCIPPSFRAWLERSGRRHGAELVDTARGTCVRFSDDAVSQPLRKDLGDLDGRIAAMDRMGIDVQLLAGWIDLTGYELASEGALGYVRAHNDLMAEEAAHHPSRLLPVATVHLQDPAGAARELDRAMTELGMVGVQVATTVGPAWLDEAGLDPFWEAAEALGAFVILHPLRPLSGVALDRYFMDNMVGRPAETTISLTGLIFAGVFERHPRLKLCAVHGGGFAPYQVGRLDRGAGVKPGLAGKHLSKAPSEYLADIYVDTVVHHPAVVEFLVGTLGSERVLLGTDYPFEMGEDDPLALLASASSLTDADRDAIRTGNAAALFGVGSGSGPR